MRLFFMMCLSGVVLATPFLFARAEDPPVDRNPAAETESLTTEPAEQQDSAEDEKEQELRKRKLEIGMIFTSIIVVMGVFLVVMILLYGRRTRRQLATGRAASAPRDELWYLKQRRDTSAADDSKSEREGDSE
jgi:hypothetical protein